MTPEANKPPTAGSTPELHVPMTDVVLFVRQLSHDLRNHLNAAELQSAYINEVAEDAELKGEVTRLRSMLSEMGGSLQKLTSSLAQVKLTLMAYEAASFVEDLRQKMAQLFPEQATAIDWDVRITDAVLNIDPQLLQPAILELFANAFTHERGVGRLRASAEIREEVFTLILREPKSLFTAATENWGREPFRKVKHGHYGLGLARTRSIIEAHEGQLSARYDSQATSLVTTVLLPVVAGN